MAMRCRSGLPRPARISHIGAHWWLGAVLIPVLVASGCHRQNQNANTPAASPSAPPNHLCSDLHGTWDDKSQRCTVSKDENGVHIDVKATYPVDLVDNPTSGPVLTPFLQKFFADWGQSATNGAGDANLASKVFMHKPNTRTVIFQGDWYFGNMAHPDGQITTFTFDFGENKQLQLADLLCPGLDPLKAIPPIVRPFVQQALAGSPFHVEQFEPNQPEGELADNYQAWALDGDDLVLYMPAGRGRGGVPPGFITPRIPLLEFSAILREKACPAAPTAPPG